MSNRVDDPKSPLRRFLMTLLLIGLGITLVASIAIAVNTRHQEVLHAEFGLNWIVRAVGTYLMAVAALAALVLAVLGSPMERVCPLVLPLLGGALLSSNHWAPALALGGIVVALVVKDALCPSVHRNRADASDTTPSLPASEHR